MTDKSLIGPDYGGWSSPISLRDILGHLAGPDARMRYSGGSGADVVTVHGHVNDSDISRMLNSGWLESMNGTYRLTDDGRRAYLRSTDELQSGELVAPEYKP